MASTLEGSEVRDLFANGTATLLPPSAEQRQITTGDLPLASKVAGAIWDGMGQADAVTPNATVYDFPAHSGDVVAVGNDDHTVSGSLVAESGAISTANDIALSARTLSKYKISSGMLRVTYELETDGALFVSEIANMLGRRIGRYTNTAFTTGTGTSQPQGCNTAATNSTVSNADAATVMADVINSVPQEYLMGAKYMIDPAVYGNLLKDTVAASAFSVGAGGEPSFGGFPVILNKDVPTSRVLFGNFAAYAIRRTGGIQLQRNDELYALNGQVGYTAWILLDGGLPQPDAIVYGTIA